RACAVAEPDDRGHKRRERDEPSRTPNFSTGIVTRPSSRVRGALAALTLRVHYCQTCAWSAWVLGSPLAGDADVEVSGYGVRVPTRTSARPAPSRPASRSSR